MAMSSEDKQLSALKVLVTENERAKFGFTQGELDRAKSEFIASIEKAYNDRTKTNSENFCRRISSKFLRKRTEMN
jgi:zinc protease